MRALTVGMLLNECLNASARGLSDKIVLISDDDEGNGYHTLAYGITYGKEDVEEFAKMGLFHDNNDPNGVVLLG